MINNRNVEKYNFLIFILLFKKKQCDIKENVKNNFFVHEKNILSVFAHRIRPSSIFNNFPSFNSKFCKY